MLGLLSGLFGGLAGNQGGLRAAAMLSLSLSPVRYVATATATAMLVDIVADTDLRLARWRRAHDIGSSVERDCGCVLIGTVLGERILLGLSIRQFRYAIAVLIGSLGLWLVVQGVN